MASQPRFQLLVDEPPRAGLVQLHGLAGLCAGGNELATAAAGCVLARLLSRCELRRERRLGLLGFGCHLLPDALVSPCRLQVGLCCLQCLTGFPVRRLVVVQRLLKRRELGLQLGALVLRRRWRNKGPGLEGAVLKGAVIPGPAARKSSDRRAPSGGHPLWRGWPHSRSPNLAKELCHLPREDALVLKAPEQLVLRLLHRHKQTHAGGRQLGQQFRELPKFQDAGVGIVREIAFRKFPSRTSCSSCT